MAGLAVHVQERRPLLGGACITEEFYPGFHNSTAAYAVSLLQPKVIRELRLHDYGLRLVERRAQNFLPLPDGQFLLMGEGQSEREIAKFSVKDAQRYPAYRDEIGRVAGAIRSMMLNAPPNVRLDSIERAWCEIRSLFGIGKDLWKGRPQSGFSSASQISRRDPGQLVRIPPNKGRLGFDAVVGNLASPQRPTGQGLRFFWWERSSLRGLRRERTL